MKKTLVGLAIGANLLFGSASIISGTTQSISFDSKPQGVSVVLDGNELCKTPCQQVVKKHAYKNIVFKKEGYTSRQMIMSESVNVLTILGGLLGTSTDAGSGALWEYSPNNYYIELNKTQN